MDMVSLSFKFWLSSLGILIYSFQGPVGLLYLKKEREGAWLAQLAERSTLNFRIMSLNTTMGMEPIQN